MKAPSASATPSGRLKISSSSTAKITAATRPRMIELRQVGGMSPRGGRLAFGAGAGFRLGAAAGRRSAVLVSMRPPWVPRLLAAALLLGLGHGRNLVGRGRRAAARSRAARGRSRGSARPPGSRPGPRPGSGRPAPPRAAGRRAAPPARAPARPPRPAAPPSGSWTLVETWARPLRQQQADRPHAGQAAAGLAQAGGDGAGDLEVAAVELDVEGGERRAGGDQGGAGAPVRQARAEVRPQLARLHPQPELGQAAVAEVGALGPLGPARQLAVEEDRDAEAADLGGDGDRLGAGGVAVGGVEPDQRADVERADRRVDAVVGASCRSSPAPPRRPATQRLAQRSPARRRG